MNLTIPKSPSKPLRESPRARVTRQLHDWIHDGTLAVGERVPAERWLAEQMGASRATVRAVLRELDQQGLIQTTTSGIRLVLRHSDTASSLSNSIVIMGQPIKPEELPTFVRLTGWEMSVQLGALSAVHLADKGALLLASDQLDEMAARRLARERPYGAVVISRARSVGMTLRDAELLAADGIPVVAYGYEEEFPGLDTVGSDQEAGAYELTRWLIGQGCQRILCVAPSFAGGGSSSPAWFKRRRAGQERAIREAGLPLLPMISIRPQQDIGQVIHEWDRQTWTRVTAGYLIEHLRGPDAPDAIMAPSDGPAATVMAALQLLGRAANKDILVTGYDNYWDALPAEQREIPPRATVDKLNFDTGRETIKLVLDRAHKTLISPDPVHRLCTPRLVIP